MQGDFDAMSFMLGMFIGLGGLLVADYLVFTTSGLIAGAKPL